MVTDKDSKLYNAEYYISAFNSFLNQQKKYYKTKNIFVPVGEDFEWENAQIAFFSLDGIIEAYRESESEFAVKYSTPSEYLEAVMNEITEDQLPTFKGDFFPYIDDKNFAWTGFFTTRPGIKRMIKQVTGEYLAAQQLFSKRHIQY